MNGRGASPPWGARRIAIAVRTEPCIGDGSFYLYRQHAT
ncbi:hypothetical protein LC55x_3781 [Lysobacter capsici]|nr:hypothetical protein LC55x_3781 [Lysobacter capsici]